MDDSDTVVALSYELVCEVAPEELPLFQSYSRAFVDNSELTEQRPESSGRVLGFGIEEVLVPLTPLIMTIVVEVVRHVAGKLGDAAASELEHGATQALHRVFRVRGGPPGDRPAALTQSQLAEVRRLVIEKAGELKMPRARATLLADAVVGRLVGAQDPRGGG
jgi:hypothetical protein